MRNLADDAQDSILKLLTSGALVYDDKLSYRRLMKVTGFGYSPVMIALKRLERAGWVEIVPPKFADSGTYVRRTSY